MAGIGDQWEVEYSRFFNFPSLSYSPSSSLVPITSSARSRLRGTWLSTSISASLKLAPDFVLSVTFLGKLHEEHYISKLNFTWPHVSCMSGFPPRGSRVVLVSYKDRSAQIQKFALRFSAVGEIEAFMVTLKELLEAQKHFGGQSDNRFVSEISFQSNFVPAEEATYRPVEDWNSAITLYDASHQLKSSLNSEVSHKLVSPPDTAPAQNVGSILEGLPPSFMSLMMMNSQPNVEEEKQTLAHQADLKLQIMRCLDDSSFQDIMGKVEQVMHEIGNDMLM